MKIEPDDLCITTTGPVANPPEHAIRNSGRLVIARKFIGEFTYRGGSTIPNAWQCECVGAPLVEKYGILRSNPIIDAANLRPLRDSPGVDEISKVKELENA